MASAVSSLISRTPGVGYCIDLARHADRYELVVREFKGKSIVPKRDPSGLSPGYKNKQSEMFLCSQVKPPLKNTHI